MFTIEYAKNPVYSCPNNSTIALTVKFAEIDEELPFGATPYDPMPYGVELYNRAVAGEFGPIAPFVEPEVQQPSTQGVQTL